MRDPSRRLTLSMVVRNEADRYLRRVLLAAARYIDDAVIIDDGSTDGTVALCHELLGGLPHRVIENPQSRFHSEWRLRGQQWDQTVAGDPDWVLFLDADEVFEDRFEQGVGAMMRSGDADAYLFRLYDFWDEAHYRDDALWQAHKFYRPFMIRYVKGREYTFQKTDQHCGRLPANVLDFPHRLSPYRLKHLGWAREADRLAKHRRYLALDPQGVYGSLPQYQSILDPRPRLVRWVEDEAGGAPG